MRPRAPLAVASFALMGVSAAATAGCAWLAGPLLSNVEAGALPVSSRPSLAQTGLGLSLSWVEIALALLVFSLARAVADVLRTHVSARMQLGVVREFRGKILNRALGVEPITLASWPHGELASRIQVEIHGVRALLDLGLSQGIRSILVATALATVALKVDSALATPGLLLMPVAVAVAVLGARPARRLQARVFAAETLVVSDTAEALEEAWVLRAYGATRQTWRRIDREASVSERGAVAADTWSAAAAPLAELVGALAIVLVVLYAWSTRQSIDLASTGSVLVALLLMYRPLRGVASSAFGWWAGVASLDRLDEVLALPEGPASTPEVRRAPVASLELDRVSFEYGEHPVFRDAVLVARAGEVVAVTGPSGAGKSTLLAVLGGLLTQGSGTIRIDGAPASREELAAATAWMPQTPAMFHTTILRNVALGDPKPNRPRVIEACRSTRAHGFIGARAEGYDGLVQEGGSDLSLGQRQRVALARALYRGAPILLLDEPTAALDDAHERQVIAVCRAHAESGGLVIVATHREDLLRHADRVLEVSDGGMREWKPQRVDAQLN